MNPLRGLLSSVRPLLDDNFRSGDLPTIEASQYEVSWDRPVDIGMMLAMVDEAMRRFRNDPEKSDAWLAPRVHATLRLTRREAADRRIWNWLNVIGKPNYVRWRWSERGANTVPIDRFMGEDSKNSFGRLWWAAELTRNGNDYSETESVLKSQRFSVAWQPLDVMHHRPAALAVCRFSRAFNNEQGLTNAQHERLAKALNLRLTTLVLDVLAPNPPIDTHAIGEWCREPIDETKYMNEVPIGPDEELVSEDSIAAVTAMLQTLADEINLVEFKRYTRKAGADGQAELEEFADQPLESQAP